MKLIIVAACLLVLASLVQGLTHTQMLNAVRVCKRQESCKENLIMVLRRKHIPTSDECLKSMACAGKKIGLFGEDNTINADVMQSALTTLKMNPEKATTITNACKTSTGADDVALAKALMTCVHDNAKH